MALALAGAVAAWAAAPVGPAWTADPEEQFLLDVNIRQLRLGDGVRAYQTPEGTCVVFGDFLTTLDLPMKIDLEAKERRAGRSARKIGSTSTSGGHGPLRRQQEKLAEARSARLPRAGASIRPRSAAGSSSASSRSPAGRC